MNRRGFLLGGTGLLAMTCAQGVLGTIAPAVAAGANGSSIVKDFSFDWLTKKARSLASRPDSLSDARSDLPAVWKKLDYDQFRGVQYNPAEAKWKGNGSLYELQAFPPGWLYKDTVQLFEVDGSEAVPFSFSGKDFRFGSPLDPKEFEGVELPGVAGFRLHYPLNTKAYFDELVAFLGASYFRALGVGSRYGISARGLALNTASSTAEEFPRFSAFYLQKPKPGERKIRIWAQLISESVTGAYEFDILPGENTIIDVKARLFFRSNVERLGIAPLTSMYLFGENDRVGFDDFRPEVHDSDGLMVEFDHGEVAWRPLINPGKLQLSFIGANKPKGFGLMQADRNFSDYQDSEAHYDKRPSLWIEPQGDWGSGAVMLAEIPSDKEINDNIVAFWTPREPVKAGDEMELSYRMYWGNSLRDTAKIGAVAHTRTGKAGHGAAEENERQRKFVVDFSAPADGAQKLKDIQPDIFLSQGRVQHSQLQYVPEIGTYRVILDVQRDDQEVPVELKLQLKDSSGVISETWLYQWGWL